jgi:hypothetical protein
MSRAAQALMIMPALIEDKDADEPENGSYGVAYAEGVHGEGQEDRGQQEQESVRLGGKGDENLEDLMEKKEQEGDSETASQTWDFSADEWAVIQEERRKQWLQTLQQAAAAGLREAEEEQVTQSLSVNSEQDRA